MNKNINKRIMGNDLMITKFLIGLTVVMSFIAASFGNMIGVTYDIIAFVVLLRFYDNIKGNVLI